MKKATLLIAFLLSTSALATEYEQCAYLSKPTKENKYSEWETYKNCASYIGAILKINPEHIKRINYNATGMATFWVDKQMFYLKTNGKYLPVVNYDNGADDFSEGLVRSLVDGKISYYNREFIQVIPAKYDWGWPFNHGRALVCSACSIETEEDGEHKAVIGGLWGYINKKGIEIIPVKYSQTDIRGKQTF